MNTNININILINIKDKQDEDDNHARVEQSVVFMKPSSG